ncbi:3-hydroxybutyrate dehydrogenase type 2-like [Penaeus japonicus]|uniref:3-hydroxybutyrate dehydrogenase type 2-like n=1 Tax=Penaeus japonicus TaxID=27405 RepID=UPI001C70D6B0|nr:3-hydroxybutyrate dehydrogenase type 2-like [Penaeus japonicus]
MAASPAAAAASTPAGRLKGKKCIVTAGAQGIGRATVLAFLREGASMVVAVDINKEKLQTLEGIPGVVTKHLDVRDGAGVRGLAQEMKDVDVLFNCAGYVHQGDILSTTEEEWDFSFDVNVKSMYHFIQAFLPAMIEKRKGSIINMSSAASTLRGIEQRAVYGATKGAVIGLTKGVARDCVQKGVRCNVVCPGPIATESYKERCQDLEDSDKGHIDYIVEKLMGRLATPEEVANLCVYLASDEASYHTGNVFTIDGGFCL